MTPEDSVVPEREQGRELTVVVNFATIRQLFDMVKTVCAATTAGKSAERHLFS
jgi:hypothetical protein